MCASGGRLAGLKACATRGRPLKPPYSCRSASIGSRRAPRVEPAGSWPRARRGRAAPVSTVWRDRQMIPSSWLGSPLAVAALASIARRRRPEVPLELPIEVLLAAIADRHRDRFDLDAGFDHFRGAIQSDARHALVHRQAECRAKDVAE